MDVVLMLVGGIAGMAAGVFGGLKWGESLREKSNAAYWFANLLVMAAGMAVVFGGSVIAWPAVAVSGVGLMGGGVTGLKYGLGRSVGVWRTVDTITGSDELPEG